MNDLWQMYIPEPNSGCWLWLGTMVSEGYGTLQVDGKTVRAHREVYEAEKGEIPEGLVLDHLCRNRICVNPDHLEPVTLVKNILRGVGAPAVNARKTHCDEGHEFTSANTHTYKRRRICKTCRRQTNVRTQARWRINKRAALQGEKT